MKNTFEKLLSALFVFVVLAGGIVAYHAYAAISGITITAPNGGEKWSATQNVTWTALPEADPGTVNIYYCSGDNCAANAYTQIVAGTANDGTYEWDTTTAGGDATTYKIKVSSNADTGIADISNAVFEVDNTHPTVTDEHIAISGGAGGAYRINDTVTATWDNTGAGDNNTDTISSVTVDFSQFGGGAAVAATNSGNVWTATYAIAAGAVDGDNKNISVTATDDAGNTTTAADTANASVDNIAPTVTDEKISISGGAGTGGAFIVGDAVTATWDNTGAGDNNTDTISSVTVDFSQFGGGAAVAATNDTGTWTATSSLGSDISTTKPQHFSYGDR